MEYVILHYRGTPDSVIELAATTDAERAVALTRRWARSGPDAGVIVAIADLPVVHCRPRAA
jgi:hypothetical protein